MFRRWKNLVNATPAEVEKTDPIDLSIAVCVLFIEAAQADGVFSPEEKDHLIATLKRRDSLSEEEAEELLELAEGKREESIDLWRFTHRINEALDPQKRAGIMEEIWRIVCADGTLEAYEEYIARKVSHLLGLTHSQMIGAKLAVTKKMRNE